MGSREKDRQMDGQRKIGGYRERKRESRETMG